MQARSKSIRKCTRTAVRPAAVATRKRELALALAEVAFDTDRHDTDRHDDVTRALQVRTKRGRNDHGGIWFRITTGIEAERIEGPRVDVTLLRCAPTAR
jgi:hypothetical protein